MGDFWMGKEHLAERRARTFVSVAGEPIDPATVVVGELPAAATRVLPITLSFDRKDLWGELTNSGLVEAFTEFGRIFEAKDIREMVWFSLSALDQVTAVHADWRHESLRMYLRMYHGWADAAREPEPFRFPFFTSKKQQPARQLVAARWIMFEATEVRLAGLVLTIEGRCATREA